MFGKKGICSWCEKEHQVKSGKLVDHKRPGPPPLKPYPGGDKCPGSGKEPKK